MVEMVLVLQPEVLVVTVVLLVGASVTRRHGEGVAGGVMPHECLEDLVTPSETDLVSVFHDLPLVPFLGFGFLQFLLGFLHIQPRLFQLRFGIADVQWCVYTIR